MFPTTKKRHTASVHLLKFFCVTPGLHISSCQPRLQKSSVSDRASSTSCTQQLVSFSAPLVLLINSSQLFPFFMSILSFPRTASSLQAGSCCLSFVAAAYLPWPFLLSLDPKWLYEEKWFCCYYRHFNIYRRFYSRGGASTFYAFESITAPYL